MDMFMMDVTDHSDIRPGDDVLLLGGTGEGSIPLLLAVQAYQYRPQCSHLQHPQPSKPVLCKCVSKIY